MRSISLARSTELAEQTPRFYAKVPPEITASRHYTLRFLPLGFSNYREAGEGHFLVF